MLYPIDLNWRSINMKFCIDCVHYEDLTGLCLKTNYLDLVTGKTEYRNAHTERTLDLTGCGKEGKFYKPQRTPIYSADDLDDLSNIPFGR